MDFDMVFEGGGAKGMVFVGALKALEEGGHGSGRLIGTSAGAITATLIAAGYGAAEMETVLGERDARGEPVFAGFMDSPTAADFSERDVADSLTMKLLRKIDIPIVPALAEERADRLIIRRLLELEAYPVLFSFIERGGFYAGNAFLDWLRDKLGARDARYPEMTLVEFHDATGRDLSLVATDASERSMLVLNHRTAPHCPIVWAVRMSMSIPFAWQEVRWQADWNPYRQLDATGSQVARSAELTDHVIVDGGVLSNFAIDKLISAEPSVRAVMGDVPPRREQVLGLLIDEGIQVPGAPPSPDSGEDDDAGLRGDVARLRTVARVSRLLDTMMGASDLQRIKANADLVCRLPARGYGTLEFDMSEPRKQALIAAGHAAMREHLAARAGG
jgi:predicted acylesterase/phospholipase RssA